MRHLAPGIACLALLAGCAGDPGDKPQRGLVAPGKYVLYDCAQLASVEKRLAARDKEFERLKARARQGPGGELISAMVYEPDYLQNLGELDDVRREQAEKKCGAPPSSRAPARR